MGFSLALADFTGLDPQVVYSWSKWENDDPHELRRPFNWLNWKQDADIDSVPYVSKDSALDGGFFPGYASLGLGVRAAKIRVSRQQYVPILQSAGKSKQTQVAAIIASPWGTKHLTLADLPDGELALAWAQWFVGRGWAKVQGLGRRNMKRRPSCFPRRVPAKWWLKLPVALAGP